MFLRNYISHILSRVEEMETRIEKQESELNQLKNQQSNMKRIQRQLQYRLEDQENRNRRQNLRIRFIKEERGEDLRKIMNNLFTPLLDRGPGKTLKIERVHRVGRIRNNLSKSPT